MYVVGKVKGNAHNRPPRRTDSRVFFSCLMDYSGKTTLISFLYGQLRIYLFNALFQDLGTIVPGVLTSAPKSERTAQRLRETKVVDVIGLHRYSRNRCSDEVRCLRGRRRNAVKCHQLAHRCHHGGVTVLLSPCPR